MKTSSKLIGLTAAISILGGCASSPDKIDAAYVSPLKYQSYNCGQIAGEMDYVGRRTNKLYQSLKKERTADNWQMGIGLVLFWPSLFLLEGGDGPGAAEYAQLKGEYEALRGTSVSKQCHIASKSPQQILEEADSEAKAQAKEEVSEGGANHKSEVQQVAMSM